MHRLRYIIVPFTIFMVQIVADQKEYDLISHLLDDYDPLERPVADFKDSVDVTMKVILQQIVGLVR